MVRAATLVGVVVSGVLIAAGQTTPEPLAFFTNRVELSDHEIAAIDRGDAVVKVLPSESPAEIFLFGAVYVRSAPEAYVRLAFDMGRLRGMPSYLGVGRLGDPPLPSDLEGFTLEPGDVKSLRRCRPGRCAVQLSADAIRELQDGVDWGRADAGLQVSDRFQRMALALVRRYRESGNDALGTYHDKDRPVHLAGQFASLLDRTVALPLSVPELNRYLLDYPRAGLPEVESLLYWEKIDFGLKPTLRVNHAMAYQSSDPRGAAWIVAVKQLYASHYFQVAFELSACITGKNPADAGFYLISLKASSQDGLTGLTGSIVRKIVVSRTRSAQEKALVSIKKALERR